MLKKCKARIEKIAKDDIKLCSSRCIWADLRDENDVLYHVKWAETPSVVGITGNWSSREPYAFENAWNKCNEGDVVWLYHSDDQNYNYFEPII